PEAEVEALFKVVVDRVEPREQRLTRTFRAHTEPFRDVVVKAETSGRVIATPVELGAFVAEGDVLCELAVDERSARVKEARAALAKARLDNDAAVKLAADGYRSATQKAAVKATLDLAEAEFETAELALARTKIRAPFAGVVDERVAEAGDLLQAGAGCARLVQLDPLLIVADAAQDEVRDVAVGAPVRARLADGRVLDGEVRFAASAADAMTRTFRIEATAPNPDRAARGGVFATLHVSGEALEAHAIPRSALVLSDDGDVGVRIVEGGAVRFVPVRPFVENGDEIVVAGLQGPVDLIVRGQGFVGDGQEVTVVRAADGPAAVLAQESVQ
ncbi:MAG: efflux RND transporter periplasmic adaptor subunit, partial [Pseudomonadota bacterium]